MLIASPVEERAVCCAPTVRMHIFHSLVRAFWPRSIFTLLTLVILAKCQEDTASYSTEEIELDKAKHDKHFFNFVTRPDIDAPRWHITVYNESAVAPGFWFVAPYGVVDQISNDETYVGAHIYDTNGELVWSGAPDLENFGVFTFKVSKVAGKDMLTVLYPEHNEGLIFNDDYEVYASVPTGEHGVTMNMHEFQIVENGERALFLNKEITTNLRNSRRVGFQDGPCEIIYHKIIEQEIETGQVVFEWSSEDHIALEESDMYEHDPVELCQRGLSDYLHANSIEKLPDGDYLFSARRTDTIYKISKNGEIVWRLGGKKNDFVLSDGTSFSGQHDARCLSQNSTHMTITLLDNAMGQGFLERTNDQSRGLVLSLNTELTLLGAVYKTMTAEAVQHYDHPHHGFAAGKGNFQTLPNGNAFITWRDNTLNSEYTPDGTLIKFARLRTKLETYRGYKFEWVGRPKAPPDVYSQLVDLRGNGHLHTAVYVSWNGATEVAFWNLYIADDMGGDTKELALTVPRSGFETVMLYPGHARYIVMEGLSHEGKKLRQSEVFQTFEGHSISDATVTSLQELLPLFEDEGASYQPSLASWKGIETIVRNPTFPFAFLIGLILGVVAIGARRFDIVAACRRRLQRRKNETQYAVLPNAEQESDGKAFFDADMSGSDDLAREDDYEMTEK